MKKFKLFLLAAVAVLPVLQSCNDSDVEGADSMALVTILNPGGLSGTFYFKADNGQTLYPSQFALPAATIPKTDSAPSSITRCSKRRANSTTTTSSSTASAKFSPRTSKR